MIEHENHDGVLVLRLAHGKANALDIELLEALSASLDAAAAADAVVLTGTGRIFSAGVDLPRVIEGGPAYARRFVPLLDQVLEKLFQLPQPVIAAANGHAIAGGCILTLACDHKVMAAGQGRIGVPELRVGVPFPVAALEIVRFAVPPDRLQELLYGGRTQLPEDARECGLVDEVVEPERLLERALAVAVHYPGRSGSNFGLAKRMLRAPALAHMQTQRERFDGEIMARWLDPATHSLVRCYLEETLGK